MWADDLRGFTVSSGEAVPAIVEITDYFKPGGAGNAAGVQLARITGQNDYTAICNSLLKQLAG